MAHSFLNTVNYLLLLPPRIVDFQLKHIGPEVDIPLGLEAELLFAELVYLITIARILPITNTPRKTQIRPEFSVWFER
jgi:hypothetical protein